LILDVGSGAGWLMLAIKRYFPNAKIEGIEPSKANADLARRAGFEVQSVKIGSDPELEKCYDLIYCNNVLQHVLSPVPFLMELKKHLAAHGRLVLICPDASRPSNEMLWCDHNYSFEPRHLLALAEMVGLAVETWQANPTNNSLLDKQLVVLSPGLGAHAPTENHGTPRVSGEERYNERCRYVHSWARTHAHLCEAISSCSRVFNLGASMWTWLLAAYCPDWWRKVDCCLVDDFSGTCLDKKVVPTASVALLPDDGLVLGINPANQDAMAARFSHGPYQIIRWDRYINR
jgi:SAM-dependent methyltransferase